MYYVQGPTKSPLHPMQIGASGKIMQKRHNLPGHNSPIGVVDKTFFTWSVLDVFVVKCEQFLISHSHYRLQNLIYIRSKKIQT